MFDDLKCVLIWESLLYQLDYQCDYFWYLTTVVTNIFMVLVQGDNVGDENPIYYLSWNLNDVEIKYTHVKKLALVVVQAIQNFCRYIILRKTMVVCD